MQKLKLFNFNTAHVRQQFFRQVPRGFKSFDRLNTCFT